MAQLVTADPCRFAGGPARPVIHPAVNFAAFHRLVDFGTALIAFDDFELRPGNMVHQCRGEIGFGPEPG